MRFEVEGMLAWFSGLVQLRETARKFQVANPIYPSMPKNPCKQQKHLPSTVHAITHKLQHTLSTKDKHLECAYEHKVTGFLVCGAVLPHAAQLFATCG